MKNLFFFFFGFFISISVTAQTKTLKIVEVTSEDESVIVTAPVAMNFQIKIGDVAYFRDQKAYDEKGNKVSLNGAYFPEVSSDIVFTYQRNYTTRIVYKNKIYICYMTFTRCYVSRIWYENR